MLELLVVSHPLGPGAGLHAAGECPAADLVERSMPFEFVQLFEPHLSNRPVQEHVIHSAITVPVDDVMLHFVGGAVPCTMLLRRSDPV